MRKCVIRLALFLLAIQLSLACIAGEPSLAMGDTEDSVTFKFVSATPCDNPVINLKNIDKGTYVEVPIWTSDQYNCKNSSTYQRYSYFFRAKINMEDTYFWSFRSENDLGPFQFKLRDLTKGQSARFIQIGDMEYSNNSAYTFQALNQMDWRKYDGLIHAGDYAYNLNNDDCIRGDRYFNALSNVLPVVPCMFILGNHENSDNGRSFNYRFRLPDYNEKMTNNFYSQIRGPVFFLYVNYDYYLTWYKDSLSEVIAYLDEELKRSQREDIKWRVVVTHRAIYCGEYATRQDCVVNFYQLKPFDELYRKYKVDIMISGHEHFYERLKTVDVNFAIDSREQQTEDGYTEIMNSPHPIQLTAGCAGNYEFVTPNLKLPAFTSKAVAYIQCYTDITFSEDTVTHVVKASENGTVLDKTVIRKYSDKPIEPTSFAYISLAFLFGFMAVVAGVALIVMKPLKSESNEVENDAQYSVDQRSEEFHALNNKQHA